jgi:hypothetical protein
LLSSEQIGRVVVRRVFVERAAVTFEHAAESLVNPPRYIVDLLVSGGADLMEAQLAVVAYTPSAWP